MPAALRSSRLCALTAAVLAVPLALVGCGSSSKAAAHAERRHPSGATAAKRCTPKSGTSLVVLADDKHSQNSDNIVPVVKTSLAKAPLTDALNDVSKALSQDALNSLNSEVAANGKTDAAAASAFISKYNVGSGLSGGSGKITIGTQSFAEAVDPRRGLQGGADQGRLHASPSRRSGCATSSSRLSRAARSRSCPSTRPASPSSCCSKDKNTTESASTEIDKTMAVLKPLALKHGFTALDPAAATDENAYAVTKATSDAYGLKTMSDVASQVRHHRHHLRCGGQLPEQPVLRRGHQEDLRHHHRLQVARRRRPAHPRCRQAGQGADRRGLLQRPGPGAGQLTGAGRSPAGL